MFSPNLLTSREERRAGDWFIWQGCWSDQPCLCNEASMKSQKDRVRRASGLVIVPRYRESSVPGESMKAQCPFSIHCPMHLFDLAIPELYLCIINWWSTEQMISWILWTTLVIEPKEEVVGTSNLQLVGQKCR